MALMAFRAIKRTFMMAHGRRNGFSSLSYTTIIIIIHLLFYSFSHSHCEFMYHGNKKGNYGNFLVILSLTHLFSRSHSVSVCLVIYCKTPGECNWNFWVPLASLLFLQICINCMNFSLYFVHILYVSECVCVYVYVHKHSFISLSLFFLSKKINQRKLLNINFVYE